MLPLSKWQKSAKVTTRKKFYTILICIYRKATCKIHFHYIRTLKYLINVLLRLLIFRKNIYQITFGLKLPQMTSIWPQKFDMSYMDSMYFKKSQMTSIIWNVPNDLNWPQWPQLVSMTSNGFNDFKWFQWPQMVSMTSNGLNDLKWSQWPQMTKNTSNTIKWSLLPQMTSIIWNVVKYIKWTQWPQMASMSLINWNDLNNLKWH